MSERWVVQLKRRDAHYLGQLRCRSDLEVCEQADSVWLRGAPVPGEDLDVAVLSLPGRRFAVLPDQQLVPHRQRVPEGNLPEEPWINLRRWMEVTIRPATFGAKVTDKVPFRLTRGGRPSESNLLLAQFDDWHVYAVNAPQVRLDRWTFAMNANGQATVRGTPIPPLTGLRFVEAAGVATPAGWTWTPSVDAEVIRTVLELAPGDVALLHLDGSWDHIKFDDFVRATRAAVRQTMTATER